MNTQTGQKPQAVRWSDRFNTNLQLGQSCMEKTPKDNADIITQKFNWASITSHKMTSQWTNYTSHGVAHVAFLQKDIIPEISGTFTFYPV